MNYGAIEGVRLPVARIVFGTAHLAGAGAFGLLDRVVEAGGNAIDTARMYRRCGAVKRRTDRP